MNFDNGDDVNGDFDCLMEVNSLRLLLHPPWELVELYLKFKQMLYRIFVNVNSNRDCVTFIKLFYYNEKSSLEETFNAKNINYRITTNYCNYLGAIHKPRGKIFVI